MEAWPKEVIKNWEKHVLQLMVNQKLKALPEGRSDPSVYHRFLQPGVPDPCKAIQHILPNLSQEKIHSIVNELTDPSAVYAFAGKFVDDERNMIKLLLKECNKQKKTLARIRGNLETRAIPDESSSVPLHHLKEALSEVKKAEDFHRKWRDFLSLQQRYSRFVYAHKNCVLVTAAILGEEWNMNQKGLNYDDRIIGPYYLLVKVLHIFYPETFKKPFGKTAKLFRQALDHDYRPLKS